MKIINVDSALQDQLLAAGEIAELRGPDGRVLGRFMSLPTVAIFVEGTLPSEEELDRRMREERSYSTAEVMERLKSLKGPH